MHIIHRSAFINPIYSKQQQRQISATIEHFQIKENNVKPDSDEQLFADQSN